MSHFHLRLPADLRIARAASSPSSGKCQLFRQDMRSLLEGWQSELERCGLRSRPSESKDFWQLTGGVLCPVQILACVQAGLQSWCMPERPREHLLGLPLPLFRCQFCLSLFSQFLRSPTRDDTVSFPSVLHVKSRVSLSGEHYLLLTAEYIILINGFPVFRQ